MNVVPSDWVVFVRAPSTRQQVLSNRLTSAIENLTRRYIHHGAHLCFCVISVSLSLRCCFFCLCFAAWMIQVYITLLTRSDRGARLGLLDQTLGTLRCI